MHTISGLSRHSVARFMNLYGNSNKGYYVYSTGAYFFISVEPVNYVFYCNKIITDCVH